MRLFKTKILFCLVSVIFISSFLFARAVGDGIGIDDKKRDSSTVHNVGNIWLRVSNYGFFGSGDNTPKWPSLEYPGGSAIDYLYQGALWFGAKKVRRDGFGNRLYWLEDASGEDDIIPENHPDWNENLQLVVDTLTTVGFDGDYRLYEFLPAYNALETSPLGTQFSQYNNYDIVMSASIRSHRRGIDDDGDSFIDEDPVGYGFPFRAPDELPTVFSPYGGDFLIVGEMSSFGTAIIDERIDIWFPLGFVDLSDESNTLYNFTQPKDDDGDGLLDEDGYPVSEQDYIGYYYDYSPFGTLGDRDFGSSQSSNVHVPLNVRVRQMSYQWSYEYIKNLIYVEFDITNMNIEYGDSLYDCAMAVYMDCDVGPQAWAAFYDDDVSSYVSEPYEFAYTYDWDGDGGLTTGFVGSRVCTPDPDSLEFACWTWSSGDGPDDWDQLDYFGTTNVTANEKYWLMTDRNPNDADYTSLRDFPNTQVGNPTDTRYLFAFYGDMQGMSSPTTGSWNLGPGRTMKIVIAVFPGDDIPELMDQAEWAKVIYENPQVLTTVTLPDTFIHYVAPEPPRIPKMFAELTDNGNKISVFWNNRSELENIDTKTVTKGQVGWQDIIPGIDSHIDQYEIQLAQFGYFPPEFAPPEPSEYLNPARVNPWTAYRLRHDFQGYAVWGRSGSGSQEDWIEINRWDKIDTDQDLLDYMVNFDNDSLYYNFGGDLGIEKGLPQPKILDPSNPEHEKYLNYYHYNGLYELIQYEYGDVFYGEPIFNYEVEYSDSLNDYAINNLSFDEQALLFKNPYMRDDVYLGIYNDKFIPLDLHGGQAYVNNGIEDEKLTKQRLASRYYTSEIVHPPKGIEYYIAATAWDRGIPEMNLRALESGRDVDANMKILFPGPSAKDKMDNIHVVPNPYVGQSKFDGRRENDDKGDKSRRIWFVNLPERCTIKIFTLAGDLVDVLHHDGNGIEDIITVSKAAYEGVAASGMEPWDLLSKNNQIIAAGVYLFSVKDRESGDKKVGKFVIIK